MNDSVVSAAGDVTDATHQPNPNENPPAETKTDSRPEWLPEKFSSPEDLAASYLDLEKKFHGKQDDLRSSLLEEIQTQTKEGVPDDPSGYNVPEGFDPEATVKSELWNQFTGWAHERNLAQDDFNELVTFYAETLTPNFETERAKLGDKAQERIDTLSRWVGANIPESDRGKIMKIAQTAEAIEALEAVMKLTVPQSLPSSSQEAGKTTQPSEQDIQKMMASPAYLDPQRRDPEVVKQVDEYFQAKYNNA